mmetsp:Transcript_28269/g.67221  ORF Transcript_28269/g.67221 Transcript_28269/m.67221 type:complete len:433 (+) Transcript_28269:119-1417(+)
MSRQSSHSWSGLAHVHASPHDLIHEEELARHHGRALNDLLLHDVAVIYAAGDWVERLSRSQVKANGVAALMLRLEVDDRLLRVVAGVLREHLWNPEKCLGKGLDAELGAALGFLAGVREEVVAGCDLKRPRPRDEDAVFERVLHGPEAVPERVLHLGDGVVGRPLQQDGARAGVLHVLHKRVLLVPEDVLVDAAGVPEAVRSELLHTADVDAPAGEGEPLHVAALGPAERQDALLGEHVEAVWVDPLHVDDHKALVRRVATHLLLEVYDGLGALVGVLALGGDEPLPLLRAAVVEAGVDLALLVLEGDVAGEDKGVLHPLGHVGVARAVVEDEAAHELGVRRELVLHVHDLDHVEVDWLVWPPDHEDRVRDDVRQLVRECLRELCAEGCLCDAVEDFAVRSVYRDLHCLKERQQLHFGKVKPLNDHSWMQPF